MKKFLKINLELLFLQIFFAVLSAMFVAYFSWINDWELIYSAFTGWLFLGAVHSTFWQLGNKDRKNNLIINNNLEPGCEKVKTDMLTGAKIGSLFFAYNILVVIATLLFDKGNGFGNVLFLTHRILLLPLAGFIPDTGSAMYWPVCVLLCVIMYIPCISAYISGAHNFSLIEKFVPRIIYKSSKKKD